MHYIPQTFHLVFDFTFYIVPIFRSGHKRMFDIFIWAQNMQEHLTSNRCQSHRAVSTPCGIYSTTFAPHPNTILRGRCLIPVKEVCWWSPQYANHIIKFVVKWVSCFFTLKKINISVCYWNLFHALINISADIGAYCSSAQIYPISHKQLPALPLSTFSLLNWKHPISTITRQFLLRL